jgi:hypothetical protein
LERRGEVCSQPDFTFCSNFSLQCITACSTVITSRKEVTTTNWGNLSEWTRVEDMRRETEGNKSRNNTERKIPEERQVQEWVKVVEDLVLVYEVEELLMLSWQVGS